MDKAEKKQDRYSVSLVFQKQTGMNTHYSLRVMILRADSEEEALGKAYGEIRKELKDSSLLLEATLKIEE